MNRLCEAFDGEQHQVARLKHFKFGFSTSPPNLGVKRIPLEVIDTLEYLVVVSDKRDYKKNSQSLEIGFEKI